ncbi:type II toxin-antitoxin system PemK/MazF family toxin [Paenibacillus naphthalenovorans]|uniref:type II toxin-antitoxin system PemK/MazF family toxin n=1 Tax=Paenibacillus naphthalenovorans TaxID=162209 RepID=UPI003D2A208F
MSIQPKLSTNNQVYKRGDIWFADLGQNMDSEMSGKRPVVIIQNDIGNVHTPNTIVTPVSSIPKNVPTHVYLDAELNGLDKESYVLTEHILTISKRKLKKRLSSVHPKDMSKIEDKLLFSCGIKLKNPSEYSKSMG